MAIPSQLLCSFQFVLLVASSPIGYNPPDTEPEAVAMHKSGNERLDTDSGLYNAGFHEGDIFRRRRGKSTGAETISLWPDGVIIYRVDHRIGCPDSAQCEILMRAINHYHTHSCIRFQEWTGEESYVYIFFNPESGACWSAVGRAGGAQLLSLGRRCWYQGIVIHELGHSVGFSHEMNRPDRDEFINIKWDNILPGFAAAFAKESYSSFKVMNEQFDYKSIMMYDEYAFAKDSDSPTILTKDNSVIGPIWRKPGLSDSDVRRIRKLYACEDDKLGAGFPYDVKCSFDSHTCGFKNAGNNAWRWNHSNASDGYVYTTVNKTQLDLEPAADTRNATEDTSFFVSVNFFGSISKEVNVPQMGCVSFWTIVRGDGDLYLKLRQSYLSTATQLTLLPEDTFDLWESDTSDTWTLVRVPLYVSNPFKLIFESSLGNSTRGLIALDDFEVQFTPCDSTELEHLNGRNQDFYSERRLEDIS